MKRIRSISLAVLAIFLLMLACGPEATPEVTQPIEDTVATSVALTRTAQALATQAAAPATDTPGPPATNTAVPTATDTPIPSPTPFCDRVGFVSESIPDGMDFEPDAVFTKSWRLQNSGACTWSSGYSLVFDHGDLMSAPIVVPLGGAVSPGQEVDIVVDMVAPSSEGTYRGHWMLRNDSGVLFGLGSDASLTFWVEIDVVAPPPIMVVIPGIIQPVFPGWLLPRTEQVFAQSTISAGATGYTEVNCPSGAVVVGGGFAAAPGVVVYNSSPRTNGWIAYGDNNTSTNQTLNAYAICLRNTAGTITRESSQMTVPAGGAARAKVTCPSGSIVTGGGFASNPNRHWVYSTLKSGNGWETYARNISGTDQAITAYAVCLSGVSAVTSQVFDQTSIPGHSSAGGEATCPTNTLTTGGGYWLSTAMDVYNSSMKPSADDTWHAFARNSAASTRLINTYAICLSFQ